MDVISTVGLCLTAAGAVTKATTAIARFSREVHSAKDDLDAIRTNLAL